MSRSHRYLFVTIEGGGNIAAVLGAARPLVERGHDVRVLTEPCLREPVEAIGARFVAFAEGFVRTDRQQELFTDWKAKSPPAALATTLRDVIFGPCETTAREVLAELDREAADALVVDWLLPAATAAGEARGLPTAVLLHCTNMLPAPGRPAGPMPPARGPLGRLRDRLMWGMFRRLVDKHRERYNAMRGGLGLRPLTSPLKQFDRVERVLVQTSEAFDFVASPEPDNVRYVGPVLDDPDWLAGQTWTPPWPADDPRPLVVVSLSSTFQNQATILQAAVSALGRLDVRGLVTLGPAMKDVPFDVPDNVVVVQSAPHGLVFPHADVFVTHCGHGSVMRALVHGVPLVALPMGRDQDGNATRIRLRGVGVKAGRNARSIAAAVQRILDDGAFAEAARQLGATITADVAAGRLLEELERLPASSASAPANGPSDPIARPA